MSTYCVLAPILMGHVSDTQKSPSTQRVLSLHEDKTYLYARL